MITKPDVDKFRREIGKSTEEERNLCIAFASLVERVNRRKGAAKPKCYGKSAIDKGMADVRKAIAKANEPFTVKQINLALTDAGDSAGSGVVAYRMLQLRELGEIEVVIVGGKSVATGYKRTPSFKREVSKRSTGFGGLKFGKCGRPKSLEAMSDKEERYHEFRDSIDIPIES